jgi:hypothetical protein
MRGFQEFKGQSTRLDYNRERGEFVARPVPHPFVVRRAASAKSKPSLQSRNANQGPYDRCANRSPLISRTVLGSAATAVADRGRSSISAWMSVKCQ